MKKIPLCLVLCLCLLAVATALGEGLLAYNSQGDAVVALQERLTALGYYAFRVTGVYQENTQKAVRLFQREHGLPETGTVDGALLSLIHSSYARPMEQATPHPSEKPQAAPTQAAPTQAAASLSTPGPFAQPLSYGSAGDPVRQVQERLTQLGFYQDQVSGNFLINTKNAVMAFQRHNGLMADGIIGSNTWQTLFFDESARAAGDDPKPAPTPPPSPYYLEVNVTTQVVTVFGLDENGEYTDILRQMICSTGTKNDATPLKTYTLNGATSRWCYFPKWGTHAQYWTRMDAANAFHSVIYTQPDPMALAIGSYENLGKPASHGCIRLLVSDAKWIYENCKKGTEVLVYEGEADEELTRSLKPPKLDRTVMLPVPTAAPTLPPPYEEASPLPMPDAVLGYGMESPAVYLLQRRLADIGYYAGTVTGGYYSGTAEAVKAFQREYGLMVDGRAGKQTIAALNGLLAADEDSAQDGKPLEEGILPEGAEVTKNLTIIWIPSPTPAPDSTPRPAPTPTILWFTQTKNP